MKAIVYEKYGSPDVLQLKEVAQPTPKNDEVLVKIHAVSANPADWHLMRGEPYFARLEAGFPKPKNPILGVDFAGVVAAVGSSVTRFQPGDEVFGDKFSYGFGGFAEYASVPEKGLVLKPDNVSFEAAAATALQGLRDKGQIQAGQKVLINGAAGGVGTFAVQLAKYYGAEVTGVCSTQNLDMVRSIGADHVIDYTKADFTQNGQQYDLIYDAVGNRSVAEYKRALAPNGKCVIPGFTTLPRLLEHAALGAWVSWRGNQKIGLSGTVQPNQQDLALLKDLLAAGKIAPVIDRRYPFAETAAAIRYLEAGHARGKVVINVV